MKVKNHNSKQSSSSIFWAAWWYTSNNAPRSTQRQSLSLAGLQGPSFHSTCFISRAQGYQCPGCAGQTSGCLRTEAFQSSTMGWLMVVELRPMRQQCKEQHKETNSPRLNSEINKYQKTPAVRAQWNFLLYYCKLQQDLGTKHFWKHQGNLPVLLGRGRECLVQCSLDYSTFYGYQRLQIHLKHRWGTEVNTRNWYINLP